MTNEATPRDESRLTRNRAPQRWSSMSKAMRIGVVLYALSLLFTIVMLQLRTTRTTRITPTRSTVSSVTVLPDRNADPTNTAVAITIAPEFEPEYGELSNCVGSFAERPGCGAEGRGGRGQTLVFFALFGGLVFIGWRIFAGVRKHQRVNHETSQRA